MKTKASRLAYWNRWRAENPDKVAAAQKRYRTKHRDRILAKRRAQYAASPRRRQQNRAWLAANRERARASRKEWAAKNRLSTLISFAKCRAKRRGLAFNLTKSDLVIPERCPVFGFKLSKRITKGNLRAPSIDRINCCRGYVRGNVAVISLRANLLKNNATAAELAAILRWLRKQH